MKYKKLNQSLLGLALLTITPIAVTSCGSDSTTNNSTVQSSEFNPNSTISKYINQSQFNRLVHNFEIILISDIKAEPHFPGIRTWGSLVNDVLSMHASYNGSFEGRNVNWSAYYRIVLSRNNENKYETYSELDVDGKSSSTEYWTYQKLKEFLDMIYSGHTVTNDGHYWSIIYETF